jgi:hypothetical protein
MKARVIETNEIEELQEDMNNDYFTKDGVHFKGFELDFNVEQTDYWEKLKHQYAGMAMQGILSNNELLDNILRGVYPPDKPQHLANVINNYATALIKRLKEKEK